MLSNKIISNYRDIGKVIVEPFKIENLNTSSYDLAIGPWFYREQYLKEECISNIYNVYSTENVCLFVKKVW